VQGTKERRNNARLEGDSPWLRKMKDGNVDKFERFFGAQERLVCGEVSNPVEVKLAQDGV